MSSDPLIGKQFGSYELKELLGRGGMAAVYRGYQASIDRSVAVKVLPAELLHDPNFGARFSNEARTLAKLTHPSILPLYDFGEANGMPYIVMPLMTNGTLADRLKNGALPLAEVVRIITPVAQALDFANKQGILHRDVKPNNILFDQHDNPYLADFGIAKALESSTSLTGTGIIGTPDYMSPEQARGDPLDHRSDLYSLGVVTYQSLTGNQLFRATTPMGIIFKHVSEEPRPLRQLRPDIPEAVEKVVLRALAKQPADRFSSASEFARALSRAAADALATPPSEGTSVHEEAPTEAHPAAEPGSGWEMPSLPPVTSSTPGRPATLGDSIPAVGAAGAGSAGASGGFGAAGGIGTGALQPARTGGPNWLLIGGGIGVLALLCCGAIFGLPLLGAMIAPGPTATPTVAVVFQDDFTSADHWNTFDDGEVSRQVQDGEYVFHSTKTKWFTWDNADESFTNVRVQVNARNTGAGDTTFGLMCNYQDDKNYYYAGIGSDGYYAIIRTEDNQDYFLTDATNNQWLYTDKLPQNQGSYTLTLECADGDLRLLVDDQEIAAVQDSTFTDGDVGLFLLTFEQADGEVRFDNLVVTQK